MIDDYVNKSVLAAVYLGEIERFVDFKREINREYEKYIVPSDKNVRNAFHTSDSEKTFYFEHGLWKPCSNLLDL